jgi:hypothetical protein
MSQLVGQNCRLCGNRIGSALDAHFCDACRNPIHNECVVPSERQGEGKCLTCGVYLATAASETRREEEQRRPPPSPGGPYPVGRKCPRCSSIGFKSVRPDSFVSFGWDRVCKGCGTRYTPPTPFWGSIAFLLVGLLLAGFGLINIIMRVASGHVLGLPAMACEGFLGFLGVLALIKGFRSLMYPGKV